MLPTFLPILDAAHGLDLSDADAARTELARRFDPAGEQAAQLTASLRQLLEEGRICDRGEAPMRWGRVTKATEESRDFSIDVVLMDGAGPKHRHPAGEVNFCIAIDGAPKFDGHGPGWVVFPPDSTHVPTVSGGTMLIVYLLPQGAMEFIGS